jgi:hypothetical protein
VLAAAVTDEVLAALPARWPDDAAFARRVEAIRVLIALPTERVQFDRHGVSLTPAGAVAVDEIARYVGTVANAGETPAIPSLYVVVRAGEPGLPADAAFLLSMDRASTVGARLRTALPDVEVHLLPLGDEPGAGISLRALRGAADVERALFGERLRTLGGGHALPDDQGEYEGATLVSGPRLSEVVLAELDRALPELGAGRTVDPLIPPELWVGLANWNGDPAAFRAAAKALAKSHHVPARSLKDLVVGD